MQLFRVVMGIEIAANYIRVAEIEHRTGQFFLSRIAEKTIASPGAEDLADALQSLIREESLLSTIASVAIDTTMTERDTIEVDSDLSNSEILSFVRAEVALHTGDAATTYKPAYQVVKSSESGHSEIFYAAMKSEFLDGLRRACAKCSLDLRFIDIDHSCIELAVSGLLAATSFSVVTVKEGQVEASICRNSERITYKSARYSDDPAYLIVRLVQDLEAAAGEIVPKIFLTGRKVDGTLVELLQKSVDDRYALLDPITNLHLSHFMASDKALHARSQLYSAAIGAALK